MPAFGVCHDDRRIRHILGVTGTVIDDDIAAHVQLANTHRRRAGEGEGQQVPVCDALRLIGAGHCQIPDDLPVFIHKGQVGRTRSIDNADLGVAGFHAVRITVKHIDHRKVVGQWVGLDGHGLTGGAARRCLGLDSGIVGSAWSEPQEKKIVGNPLTGVVHLDVVSFAVVEFDGQAAEGAGHETHCPRQWRRPG